MITFVSELKQFKHISKLNLVLFLVSFLLLSIVSVTNRSTDSQSKFSNKETLSQQSSSSNSNTQQLSEENETESENSLEPAFKFLPFFTPFKSLLTVAYLTENSYSDELKAVQPIYISINNLRI